VLIQSVFLIIVDSETSGEAAAVALRVWRAWCPAWRVCCPTWRGWCPAWNLGSVTYEGSWNASVIAKGGRASRREGVTPAQAIVVADSRISLRLSKSISSRVSSPAMAPDVALAPLDRLPGETGG
jgi:hypothetical protein